MQATVARIGGKIFHVNVYLTPLICFSIGST